MTTTMTGQARAGVLLLLALGAGGAGGCGGTTGGDLIQIPFQAGGMVRDVTRPFTFTTGQGWTVTLSQAQAVLGPVYFNIDAPEPDVFRSGVVIMQITRQFIVDLVDPTLATVAGGASGETGTAVAVEIGLLSTVNDYNDNIDGGLAPPLAEDGQAGTAFLAGQASKDGVVVPFAGRVQITSALVTPLDPIAWLARVSGACPIGVPTGTASNSNCNLTFTTTSGTLALRVDPSHWFNQANFCNLVTPEPRASASEGGVDASAPVTPDAEPVAGDSSDAASAGAAEGGASRATPAPCAPVEGTVYGWSDSNPFNLAVLSGMQGTDGVYYFSLGQP